METPETPETHSASRTVRPAYPSGDIHQLPSGELIRIPEEVQEAARTIEAFCQAHGINDFYVGRVYFG